MAPIGDPEPKMAPRWPPDALKMGSKSERTSTTLRPSLLPSWAVLAKRPESAHEGRTSKSDWRRPLDHSGGGFTPPPPPPPGFRTLFQHAGERVMFASTSLLRRLKTTSTRRQHDKTRQDGFKKASRGPQDALRGHLGPNLGPSRGPKV